MGGWLHFAIPSIVLSLLVIGGGLAVSYLAIRAILSFLAPAKSHMTGYYFGYFWMASILAIVGYLISEFGYHLNFWKAPGIWGAPGKESTLWNPLQYFLSITGLAVGLALNAILEHRWQKEARSLRIGIAVSAALLLIVTLAFSAWHAMQTLG
jgi:hypothetical protein